MSLDIILRTCDHTDARPWLPRFVEDDCLRGKEVALYPAVDPL